MSQDESGNAAAPGLNRFLKADEGLAGYLIGHDHPDPRLAAVAAWSSSRTTFEELLLPDGVPESLRRLTQETAIVHLYGPPGSGRKSAAQAMCTERGARLLVADVAALLASDPFGSHLRTVLREARLRRAVLLFDGFDAVLEDSHRAQYQALCRELRNRRGITVLAGTRKWAPPGELLEGCFAQLEFAIPPFETRIELWRRFSGRESGHESLAAQFRFTPGQIRETVLLARSTAEERTEDREVTTADLEEAARSRSNTKLAELAVRIEPRFGWDDIVLPPDRIRQLRELCDAAKHRARVSESWGFSRKLHATGINVLFSGPSGTGKTMAAEVMAGDLGLDLYKIDLSTVVSKYIGETEKNLSRIFHEAETSNAILFFDEADALFGKRTEIQDAHDRYANIETNYLLQKMEAHEGLAILATNLHKNLDEAFTRRVHGMVEFAMPGEGDRLRIWRNIWPAEAPLDSEVDLEFMARRFEVTGGNIRNIALAAAFLASAEGAAVGMRHLVKATRREYQKMRTVVGADHFGEYAVYARP